MFVKSHSNEYMDEIGFISKDNKQVHFMDGNIVDNTKKLKLSSVVRVSARWMYKDIKIKCRIADTISKKRIGLQNCFNLDKNEGMYFPYYDYTDVIFHQGMVPYSLDIIFMRDFKIIGMKQLTKVGSLDKWKCENCDGVIEVNGGFCRDNGVDVEDEILINAVSEIDIKELKKEKLQVFDKSVI